MILGYFICIALTFVNSVLKLSNNVKQLNFVIINFIIEVTKNSTITKNQAVDDGNVAGEWFKNCSKMKALAILTSHLHLL